MKKSLIIITGLLLSCTTIFANGNTTNKADQVALYQVGEDQFRLIYPFKEKSTVSIVVLDSKGKIVDRDKVYNKDGFLRRYDMSSLKPGHYVLVLKNGTETIEKEFDITAKKQMALQNFGDKRVRLLVDQSVDKGTIRIYDANKTLIHQESFKGVKGMARVYDLSGFNCCQFTFKLNGDQSLAINTNH